MIYDIIIVGAGPAGLSTGLHLEKINAALAKRTLILEQARHPRPKLCAGGIMPGAQACLNKLGLDMDIVPSAPVSEIELRFDGRTSKIRRPKQTFRTVRRIEFDAWLADEARRREIQIQEEVKVKDIHATRDLVEVLTNQGIFRTRVVIGADGSASVIRRAINKNQTGSSLARLVEIRRPASKPSATALFDFSWLGRGIQGYFWEFPYPSEQITMHSWGVFDSRLYSGESHGSLKKVLDQGLEQYEGAVQEYRLEGHPLQYFHPRTILSAPRVLLVGDAAGTDPVVGEGISFALGYGELAALSLQRAFEKDDFSFSHYYRQLTRHRTGRFLKRRLVAAHLLYGLDSPKLYRMVWPMIGWLAQRYFIDWSFGIKER
ncbi:MAG: NAD(P)/FAD-dependent oxidoreductase [Anaerolineales bacterium]|nr:NAD(P)/FAD-dependent oxidoreductase [Anaerolineales bacterium]